MEYRILLMALAAHLPGFAAAGCYTVYDDQRTVVYRSTTPPVDMSKPLSQTVPVEFGPGSAMLIDANPQSCGPVVGVASVSAVDVLSALVGDSDTDPLDSEIQHGVPGTGGGMTFAGSTRGVMGFPNTGPRGGQFRYSASGGRVYAPRRR